MNSRLDIGYVNSKKRFLAAAFDQRLLVKQVPIEPKGPNNEILTVDFACKINGPGPTLIHIIGAHGAEGYVGTEIQCRLIKESVQNAKCNVIFVHPLNPYGMSWFRRVNNRNVDLNRNGLDRIGKPPSSENFGKFRFFLDSKTGLQMLLRIPKFFQVVQKIGINIVIREIASGQYDFPDSLFFGGSETQPELKILVEQIQLLAPDTTKWAIIDTHTGLGPRAVESLILGALSDQDELNFFKNSFSNCRLVAGDKEDGYYLPHGLLGDYVKRQLKEPTYYITQEFGTLHFLKVFYNLIKENARFNSKSIEPALRQMMLDTFYPDDPAWKKEVINKGIDRFNQLATTLG